MNVLIIIPSRLASTRLPNKPLVDIDGKPMIVRVMEQAMLAGIGSVIVASGDAEITSVVEQAGGNVINTDPDLPSGSDRIYAALSQIEQNQQFDAIINLQGDLPLIAPEDIKKSLLPLSNPSIDIGTLIAPITTEEEKNRSSVVKVACSFDHTNQTLAKALYFSRSVIPWGANQYWHHVGIYAYRPSTLKKFISLPESYLEKTEKLEQLRALEAGMTIGCAMITHAPLGVDTVDDLEIVRTIIKNKND